MKKISKILMCLSMVFIIPLVLMACNNETNHSEPAAEPEEPGLKIQYAKSYEGSYDTYRKFTQQEFIDSYGDDYKEMLLDIFNCPSKYEGRLEEIVYFNECSYYEIYIPEICISNKEENKRLSDYYEEFVDAYNAKYAADSNWHSLGRYNPDFSDIYFTTTQDRDVVVYADPCNINNGIDVWVFSCKSNSFESFIEYINRD